MGKKEREEFRRELGKLSNGKWKEDTDPGYLEQNAKVAAAEKKLSRAENLWTRGTLDD
jgi:hypothetical protein